MEGDAVESIHPPVEEDGRNGDEDALNNSSKAAVRALNPEGKQSLDLKEVLDHMKNVQGRSKKRFDDAGTKDKHLEKVIHKLLRAKAGKGIEERDMKKLNERFMSGHLPRLKKRAKGSTLEEKSDDDDEDSSSMIIEKSEGWMKWGVRYSVNSARRLLKYGEKSVSKAGRQWMFALLPTGQISTLVSFLLFSYVMKADFLAWFIPLAILMSSICVMLVSSLRLVRGAKRFEEFKAWADFLDAISETHPDAIDTDKAEENYVLNHVSPYIQFMAATIFCVMAHGTSDQAWVMNAELGILSLVMFGLLVYIYNFTKSWTSIALFVCQILSTVSRGFRCGGGKDVFAYFTSLDLPFLGIAINISLSSLFRVLFICRIVLLFCSPRHKNEKFTMHLIKFVFPHIVALAWWDVADMFFCYSSPTGVIRAAVECLALCFAMPVFFAFTAFAIIKYIFSLAILKVAVTFALVATSMLYFKVKSNRENLLSKAGKFFNNKSVKTGLIISGSLFLGYIMISYRPSGLRVPASDLKWENYRKTCLDYDTTLHGDEAHMSVACHEFKGYDVTWEGTMEKVTVVDIENKVEDFLNLMPRSFAFWLSCVYGQPYPTAEECKHVHMSIFNKSLCRIPPTAIQRPCHIQNHNRYKFKILISMQTEKDDAAPQISLDVSHDFHALVFSLKKGSPLRFMGTLTSGKPVIEAKVLYASMENDEVKGIEKRYRRIEHTLGDMMDEALESLYNFILYPIVSFTSEEADSS